MVAVYRHGQQKDVHTASPVSLMCSKPDVLKADVLEERPGARKKPLPEIVVQPRVLGAESSRGV